MTKFLIRKEPFGGVVCNTSDNDNVLFVNAKAYSVISAISERKTDPEIIAQLQSAYESLPARKCLSFISRYRRLFTEPSEWNLFLEIGDEDSAVNCDAKRAPALHMPLDFYWETTRKCNLRCLHCYNNSGPSGAHPNKQQIEKVFEDLDGVSLRTVTISGGEALLRKDIREIVERMRKQTFCLVLGTNGTLINDQNADWIADNCNYVNLSLDAPFAKEYDAFRGKTGSFLECESGLRKLLCRDVNIVAQTTISKYNINSLEKLADFLLDCGVSQWSCRFPFFTGNINNNKDVFLNKNEQLLCQNIIESVYEKYKAEFVDLALGLSIPWSYEKPYQKLTNKNRHVSCAAGTVLAVLHADGTMAPCQLFSETDNKSDPIWESSIYDQWHNAKCFVDMRNIELKELSPCWTCSNANAGCGGGCRARAYIKDGHLYGSDSECGYRPENAISKDDICGRPAER